MSRRRDFKAHLRADPPVLKVRQDLLAVLYVWPDRITRRRPIGAFALPLYDTRSTAGVSASINVPENTPTMTLNGKAHRKVILTVTGPDFTWQVHLGEGERDERIARDAADRINLITRQTSP